MIFAKEIITPLNTPEEILIASILTKQLKNANIQHGLLIQTFSGMEVQKFTNYWILIKPMFDVDKIQRAEYHIRWDGSSGSELYEFEFDSITGHRMTLGFYQQMKEYDLYFYHNINQQTHTFFIMGKTPNLLSSRRFKDMINLFQT